MTIFDALKMRYHHFDTLVFKATLDPSGDDKLGVFKAMRYCTAAALMECTILTLNCEIGDIDEARLFTEDAHSFGVYLGELEGKYVKLYNNIRPAD